MLFSSTENPYKVVMTPDPIEAIMLTAHYLYGNTSANFSAPQIQQMSSLLRRQKPRVEAYADFRAKYLLATENCMLGLLKSSFLCGLLQENPHIQFSLPKEGAFTSIENIVISKNATKEDWIYAFINFMYQPEIMAMQINLNPSFPACLDALPHTNISEKRFFEILAELQTTTPLLFFNYILDPDCMRKMWIDIKTAPS